MKHIAAPEHRCTAWIAFGSDPHACRLQKFHAGAHECKDEDCSYVWDPVLHFSSPSGNPSTGNAP
jgi:hypothetical protein